jgi:NitT/TauT family transport system ATP-binding protein
VRSTKSTIGQQHQSQLNTTAGSSAAAPAIDLRGLDFRYGPRTVLESIDIQIPAGEILVLIGPSGCGKSTLLNLIAGMLRPSAGSVVCFGEPVTGPNRRVTYMTQKDTLLPWRSAVDNAALPLEIKGVPRQQRQQRARAELARLGLGGFEQSRPHQLSGGMRSRLSLARALLSDSDIFLMDEPFAAIDALLRVKLQQFLVDLWQATRKTIVYVTHDLTEAIALGHRVLVMSAHPGHVSVERAISVPQPRDIARFRTTTVAQQAYAELWDELEKQLSQ